MTILDLNAPGYTMLHWLTILLENREFDTSAPLAAEAKEYLMNTFHLDYLKPIIQNDKTGLLHTPQQKDQSYLAKRLNRSVKSRQ